MIFYQHVLFSGWKVFLLPPAFLQHTSICLILLPFLQHISCYYPSFLLPISPAPAPCTSPAGTRYHVELSRELADFLTERLKRAGGLMPLTDVYCLFNRARGTELVSPDDLLAAAELMPKVGQVD